MSLADDILNVIHNKYRDPHHMLREIEGLAVAQRELEARSAKPATPKAAEKAPKSTK